jgi:hypothetical protein
MMATTVCSSHIFPMAYHPQEISFGYPNNGEPELSSLRKTQLAHVLFTFFTRRIKMCWKCMKKMHFWKYVDWFDFCLVKYLEAPEIIFLCHGLRSSIDWHRYGKSSSCRYMILPGKPCVFHVKLLSHWRLLYDIDNLIPFGNFDLDVETQTYWQSDSHLTTQIYWAPWFMTGWWSGTFLFVHILGMSSSQLTFSHIFQRGRLNPTRWLTIINHILTIYYPYINHIYISHVSWKTNFECLRSKIDQKIIEQMSDADWDHPEQINPLSQLDYSLLRHCWFLFVYLICGLEHVLFFHIYILGTIILTPNWRSHIFQRGRLNHQPVNCSSCVW